MKKELSRNEARTRIEAFFAQKQFTAEEVRKIKRLAMKYRIRLGKERERFCKKCLSQLRGKTRVTTYYKTVACENCGFLNRFKH